MKQISEKCRFNFDFPKHEALHIQQNNNKRTRESIMEFLTVDEAAKVLKITKHTVYKWAEAGKIPSRKFGPKCLRFLFSDLEEFTRNQSHTKGATA